MKHTENLAQEIANYSVQAENLENVRQDLVKKINTVIREEIIPQVIPLVIPLLPENFSINENKSEASILISDSVPIVFSAYLRLLYSGEPIYPGHFIGGNMSRIQHKLKPQFEEIAKKYGLAEINVMGELLLY